MHLIAQPFDTASVWSNRVIEQMTDAVGIGGDAIHIGGLHAIDAGVHIGTPIIGRSVPLL